MDEKNLKKMAMHPALQETLAGVRRVGLHKVASTLHDLPEVTLKTAMEHLGRQLYQQHLKQQKIQSGLDAYDQLEND